MKRIGILTSSRADFGIYLPLISKLKSTAGLEMKMIVFGTHLSAFHGHTIDQIKACGFNIDYTVESMLLTDSPSAIATSIGLTSIKFADFWKEHTTEFDIVFCLGDRYEMFAAVMAGIPFQITFAHLHGGETTLGAIDNVFRHAITLSSKYHFVSTESYANKVKEITGTADNIYNVGALSLDNIKQLKLLTVGEFKFKWNIDLTAKTVLITFHPETIAHNLNQEFVIQLIAAIKQLNSYQILITMPNADTAGNIIRSAFIDAFTGNASVFLIENLGSQSYFTAMKYCSFMLGNTSSGIIEAASFGKYVINLGDRQKGRLHGENVIDTKISANDILEAVKVIESSPVFFDNNIYYNGGATDKIVQILKMT